MHQRTHVGRGLDDHAVEKRQGQLDALEQLRSPVGEDGQTLGLGGDVVPNDVGHPFQVSLRLAPDVLLGLQLLETR